MKKVLMIVIAAMMAAILAACGSGNNPGAQEAAVVSEQATEEAQTGKSEEMPATEEAEPAQEPDSEEDTEKVETTAAKPEPSFSATIDETVLVDDKDVKITATELSYNNYQAQLSVKIENNSDKDLTFLAGTMGYPLTCINSYMVTGGYLNEDVAAGMTANEQLSFDLNELTVFGFQDIAEISVGFKIQDGYDDYYESGPVTLKTSADPGYDYSADTFAEAMSNGVVTSVYDVNLDYSSDEVIFDEAGISVANQYVGANKDGKQLMFMEVKNDSENDVYASMADIKVNGVTVSSGTWDSDYIIAGKRAVMSISLDDVLKQEYMKALGMDAYSNLDFDFIVRDNDGNSVLASAELSIEFGKTGTFDYSGEVLYSENGITIMKVGLLEDPSEYSNDIHALYLVKNENDFGITIDDKDEAYIDKVKIDCIGYSKTVGPGECALVDAELNGDDFEANNFDTSNIGEVMIQFEIKNDNYDTIDEPSVTMTMAK